MDRKLITGFVGAGLLVLVLAFLINAESLTLVWEPSDSPDVLGYRVYWGRQSGVYPNSMNVGISSRATINDRMLGYRYFFVITALDFWGNESKYSNDVNATIGEPRPIPTDFKLNDSYPNPFQPGIGESAIISYELPEDGNVSIQIFNSIGQYIRSVFTDFQYAGEYQVLWNGKNDFDSIVPSGIYYIRIRTNQVTDFKKISVLK